MAFTHLHAGRWAASEPQTPPPPWWGRAVCLSELASLGKPGEGVALAGRALSLGVLSAAVTPSPRFSKFASSLRETALPHQGGGGVPAIWQEHWSAKAKILRIWSGGVRCSVIFHLPTETCVHPIALKGGGQEGVG